MKRQVLHTINLKNVSRVTVLNYIRHHGKSTRANLSNVTGLTFMAIKNILEELEDLGLVQQSDELEGKIGRKAANYIINKDYAYTIGIHINMFLTRVALMNLDGEILEAVRIPMNREHMETSQFMDDLCNAVEKVISKSKIPQEKILGIGIGTPGPIDVEKGTVLNPPNFRLFRYFPLREVLQTRLNLPVLLNKDTNAIAMGEFWRGAASGTLYESIIYVDADMGIGSGMITDGQLQIGANSAAGEFGHVTIDFDGPVCNCGSRGCLEAISSGLSILRQVKEIAPSKRQALKLEGKHEVDQLTDIFAAAAAGDAEIISIINKAALNMGEALGSLVNLLDPELVVLGGMLVYEYEPFYAIAKDAAENKCLRVSKDIQMARGKLRYKAGVIGAGEIVAGTFFSKTVNDLLSKEKE